MGTNSGLEAQARHETLARKGEWQEPGALSASIRWWKADVFLAILAALVAAWFVWGAPQLMQSEDYQQTHHHYRIYLKNSIWAGDWPWWNPYVALGRPFVADPESAVFYPTTWLWVVLPEKGALWSALALHVAFFGIGVRRLITYWKLNGTTALTLAAGLCLGQVFLARAIGGQIGYIFAIAYWPWWLRWAEELGGQPTVTRFLRVGFAVALGFLAGHPQAFWLGGAATALYLVGLSIRGNLRESCLRTFRNLGCWTGACAFGLAVGAVQLLPLLELSQEGNRLVGSREFASSWSMPWEALLGFVSASHNVRLALAWEGAFYLGWAVILLLPWSLVKWREPRVRALWLVGVAGLLMSLGRQTPVFDLAYPFLPGLGGFRLAIRFSTLAAIALILLAAWGWTAWREKPLCMWPLAFSCAAWMAGLACCWLRGGIPSVGEGVVMLLGGCFLLASAMQRIRWLELGWPYFCVLEAVCALAVVVTPYSQMRSPSTGQLPPALATMTRTALPPPRLLASPEAFQFNAGMTAGAGNVLGYVALTPWRVWYYVHAAAGADPSPWHLTFFDQRVQAMGFDAAHGLNVTAKLERDGSVLMNPSPGTRVWLARTFSTALDWGELFQSVTELRDGQAKAVLERAPPNGWGRGGSVEADEGASITRFEPDLIEVHTKARAPALLVLAEAWYPGWVAFVDGTPREVVPVNAWMRGVWLEGAEQPRVVRLVYRPTDFGTGLTISLGALALAALLWARERRTSRTRPQLIEITP